MFKRAPYDLSLGVTKDTSLTLDILMVLGPLCQEPGAKTKYMSYYTVLSFKRVCIRQTRSLDTVKYLTPAGYYSSAEGTERGVTRSLSTRSSRFTEGLCLPFSEFSFCSYLMFLSLFFLRSFGFFFLILFSPSLLLKFSILFLHFE